MASGHAHLELEWQVVPGQAQPVAAALQAVMLATRREVGCLGCRVSTLASDRILVCYAEDWETEEALRRQVRSDRFRMLATLVESATEPPRIAFVLPDGTHGMEYALKVREVS